MAIAVPEPIPVSVPVPPGGLRALLTPPAGPLQRLRWLMLLAAIVVVGAYGVVGTRASAVAGLAWPLAAASVLGLIAVWVYAYRRGQMTLLTDALVAAGLVLMGFSLTDPRYLAFAVYASGWMRALHGTPRQAALATALYLVAFGAGARLTVAATSPLGGYVLTRSAMVILFAAAFAGIGAVLMTYERTIARERRLREAAHALAEARGRPSIYAAALSAARDLLAGTQRAAVELAIGSTEDATVVASAGEAGAPGDHLRLADVPGAEALADGRPLEVQHAGESLWRALDLQPHQGSILALPLEGLGTLTGALVVGSERPLSAELRDDLETLADLTGLAVESEILLDRPRAAAPSATSSSAPTPPTAGAAAAAASSGAAPFDRVHARVGSAVQATAPVKSEPIWRMPHGLAARVRWILFLFALGPAVGLGVYSLLAVLGGSAEPLRWVAVASPLWLGGWFVYGYRRQSFPLVGDVVIGLLLLAVVLSGEATAAQFALYPSMFVRACYGSRGRVALGWAIHVAALLGAAALAGDRGVGAAGAQTLVVWTVVLAVIAAVIHLISDALGGYERALARTRALRIAGAHLVAATTREHVYRASLDGARALAAGIPGATALVASGGGDDLATVAASGAHGEHAAGGTLHLRDVPAALGDPLHAGTSLDQPRSDLALWQALGLEGDPGSVYAVPLHTRGALEGALVVGADAPLDTELKDDLQTLAALAALAIEDVILAET